MPITVSSSLPFGQHMVDNNTSLQLEVSGTSTSAVTASIGTVTGTGTFNVSPASGTLTADGLFFTVVFRATAVGNASATLTVTADGVAHPVALTGEGIAASGYTKQAGSYLLIQVPDYGDTTFVNASADKAVDDGVNPAEVDGNMLQSYLRLGAFDFNAESASAKELLRIIPKAGPARNPASPEEVSEILTDVKGVVFVDDVRLRPQDRGTALTVADDPDHGLTAAQRAAESAKLYSRGGWRDHSDGNRITTTWGDKVEVVRGNYKMIVLGRQNDPAAGIGWEASGGHIQDYAPGTMPGASFWLEWIDDPRYYAPADPVGDGRKGLWLLVNTTENVYEYARTAGTLRSEVWGDVHESYTGSETPPTGNATFATDDTHGTGGHSVDASVRIAGLNYGVITPPDADDNKGKVRCNPHVIEKTWARRIDSYTGSKICPVPNIVEKTWADYIDGYTGESSKRITKINEETWATDTEELVDVSSTIKSNTRAGAIFEATTAGSIMGATTAAAILESTTCGVHVETHLGGLHVEVEVGIGHVEVEIGLKAEFKIAGGRSYTIGEVIELRGLAKKELAKKKVTLAMETLQATMKSQNASVKFQIMSLNLVANAMSVQLGL